MGDALQQIDQAVTCIDIITSLGYEISDTRDFLNMPGAPVGIQRRQYPVVAIRELVANAVMHRSYFTARGGQVIITIYRSSLRITSPGGLPPGLTVQDHDEDSLHSSPRNLVLSWYMHRLTSRVWGGRVFEGHGKGVVRARQAIHSYGGSLTFKELPAGAVVATVTAGISPLPTRQVQ